MATFSATEVALTGVRFVRDNPRTIAVWAGISLVYSLTFSVLQAELFGAETYRAVEAINAVLSGGTPDSATIAALQPSLMLNLWIWLTALVAFSVSMAALSRVVLAPAQPAFHHLRLGADEWRQAALLLLVLATAVGVWIIYMVAVILGGLLLFLLGQASSTAGVVAGAVLVVLTALSQPVILCLLGVRFSLAGPMTFARRKVTFFASWKLTRGFFWKLFGCYLLAFLIGGVVCLVVAGLGLGVGLLLSGGDWRTLLLVQPTVERIFSPTMLIIQVFGAIASAIFYPVVGLPGPVIYRHLTDGEPVTQQVATTA